MKNKNFAIFILTFGRAEKVFTYKTLKKTNYSGEIYFIVSDDDKEVGEYVKKYGEKYVKIFNKEKIAKTFDTMDNFGERRSPVYARNACFDIAREIGITYFLMLDDDYSAFYYRYNKKLELTATRIKNFDELLDCLLDFYKNIPAKAIAMSQAGDFIGGDNGFAFSITRLRKVMNTFFCSTERQFEWKGNFNDDVNTYIHASRLGDIFLTIPWPSVIQKETQSNAGGLTEAYLKLGTYVKSFYTIMIQPSSVKICLMGCTNKRIHHSVCGVSTYPMILRQK